MLRKSTRVGVIGLAHCGGRLLSVPRGMIVKRWHLYVLAAALAVAAVLVAVSPSTLRGFGPLVDAVRRDPQRGLFASSLAFGVQTVAQRFTSSTHMALIFAAEPVFAALFSFLLIGEVLGPQQLLGCGLILAGDDRGGDASSQIEKGTRSRKVPFCRRPRVTYGIRFISNALAGSVGST